MRPSVLLIYRSCESCGNSSTNCWERSGLTALLITHDLEKRLLMAQKVHIMAQDRAGRTHRGGHTLDASNLRCAAGWSGASWSFAKIWPVALTGSEDQEPASCWRQESLASTTGIQQFRLNTR